MCGCDDRHFIELHAACGRVDPAGVGLGPFVGLVVLARPEDQVDVAVAGLVDDHAVVVV